MANSNTEDANHNGAPRWKTDPRLTEHSYGTFSMP